MHVQLQLPHALHRRDAPQATRARRVADRETRLTRDLTMLVAVATGAAVTLWVAAAVGLADAAWWPLLLAAAIGVLVALGAWVARRDG